MLSEVYTAITDCELKLNRPVASRAALELAVRHDPGNPELRKGLAVLIVYALVGRYQMIDLEEDRSFVRKLLAEGIDVYFIDWGHPSRAQRWLTIETTIMLSRISTADRNSIVTRCGQT